MEAQSRTGTGIIFPGISASRYQDVARFLLINPAARALTAQAEERLGYSLLDRYREAEGEYSEFERVAFLITCLALAEWAEENYDMQPDICAGPSFGGTAAAVYSGALSFPDAVWMTARWSDFLDHYFAHQYQDVVTQSFARTPPERLSEILTELDDQNEWYDVACYVDHDFYMLSVRSSRLAWLKDRLRSLGGFPLYTMRPPMHSPAFQPLRDEIESGLFSGLPFSDPAIPIVSDHDGALLTAAGEVRTMLLDAIVRPVRWPSVAETLKRSGAGRLFISGRNGLWGRVSCMADNFEVITVDPQAALRPRSRRPSIA